MYTATQVSKIKCHFQVTPTTSETFHPALKNTVSQNLSSLYQNGMPFRDPSLRTLENNSNTNFCASGQWSAAVTDFILITSAQSFSCLIFRVIFLNVLLAFSLHHHFALETRCSSAWDALPLSDLNLICYLTRLEILISALLWNPHPEIHLC